MGYAIRRPDTAFSLDPRPSKKTQSFKDEAHLAFIRKLPCVITAQTPVDAAHIRAGSPLHNKKATGAGQKASDCWTLPLHRSQHDDQHASGDELGWWRSHGIDPFELSIRLYEVTGDIEAATRIIRAARPIYQESRT